MRAGWHNLRHAQIWTGTDGPKRTRLSRCIFLLFTPVPSINFWTRPGDQKVPYPRRQRPRTVTHASEGDSHSTSQLAIWVLKRLFSTADHGSAQSHSKERHCWILQQLAELPGPQAAGGSSEAIDNECKSAEVENLVRKVTVAGTEEICKIVNPCLVER